MTDLQILTVDQVAELVQLSAKTVMRAIHAGDLDASQLTQGRGGWRIQESAVASWLEARSNRQRPRALPSARPIEPTAGPRRPPRRSSAMGSGGRLVA